LAALLRVQSSAGPDRAMRYNGFLSADVNGGAAPGYSSGEAQAAVERIAAETLPRGISFEWTDLVYQEILAGNSAIFVFPLAVLLVFLVLAALYESLTLPLSIIMIVPMSLLAAMTGVWLRPILMTSLAFIMGVVPLVTSTGAGAEMRHAMGVAVFAGMIGVTAFGIFLTPVFYVLLRQLTGNRPLKQHGAAAHSSLAGGPHPEPVPTHGPDRH
jgi:multidrug efflux pump